MRYQRIFLLFVQAATVVTLRAQTVVDVQTGTLLENYLASDSAQFGLQNFYVSGVFQDYNNNDLSTLVGSHLDGYNLMRPQLPTDLWTNSRLLHSGIGAGDEGFGDFFGTMLNAGTTQLGEAKVSRMLLDGCEQALESIDHRMEYLLKLQVAFMGFCVSAAAFWKIHFR